MAELGALEAMVVQGAQEAMVEMGALEAMAELGALEAMAELGALEAMAELGALEAMAELGALEAMADGLRGPWSLPLARPLQPEPFYPPKKKFPGEVRGYQEPSGAGHTEQYKTRQERPSRARQTGQDIPQEPEALLGWLGSWGFLWAWRRVRGPHRVPQQGWKLTFLSTGHCGWWISKSTSHSMFLPATFLFLTDNV